MVQCDSAQITQVLRNILMNGLQILQHGGRVALSTHDAGANLCIEIADDGPGIDPALRTQVFEAFFFRREGGIGIGIGIGIGHSATDRGLPWWRNRSRAEQAGWCLVPDSAAARTLISSAG